MKAPVASLSDLNERSREIFRRLVESYLETGEPVGSRTLSRASNMGLSPASVRNVMQDLEHAGLLDSPHVSAGRIPTQIGLRMFVDGLLEIGDISAEERNQIERRLTGRDRGVEDMFDEAGGLLSGLSHCASLVFAPKHDSAINHVEFVLLNNARGLVILVMEDGSVENRLFQAPAGLTPSAMREAANFLNAHLRGRTLEQTKREIAATIAARRQELDDIATGLVEQGIALWDGDGAPERLIVHGRANLICDSKAEMDLDLMRRLFDDLERKRDLSQLLDLASEGEGVRIFIGSENKLFSLSGSSLVISPYMNAERKIIGAIGVIGPTRLNYGRIVPIVDYTARLIGRVVSARLID